MRNPYKSAAWKRLRLAALTRDLWQCRQCMTPLTTGRTAPNAAAVDHIKPHKGDPALFLDLGNLQSLCKRCHDSGKQADERLEVAWVMDADGWPLRRRR